MPSSESHRRFTWCWRKEGKCSLSGDPVRENAPMWALISSGEFFGKRGLPAESSAWAEVRKLAGNAYRYNTQ